MNRLAAESSLYLRQHADNPVDWYPWGDEAFARAAAEDRPVLVSIGYSSCHWCHVMAHESFEDPATAALMNELFVNVKVDREERPDVDALYMQATMALSGQGGWPMTVFLTPDRRPFFAGTYFPPDARGGHPGFRDVLRSISDAYLTRRGDVDAQAAEVTRRLGLHARRAPAPARDPAPEALEDAVVGMARTFDPVNGGFGGAPKFPPAPALGFLMQRVRRRPGQVHAREMVDLTLTRMADGGVHDQVGGGFHRYSVDAHWLVPHFEKMLYDNALLASAYAGAYEATGEPRWREVAERTLGYLLREMRVDGGAFAAAQDADSPGGEGAFFTWTDAEIREALPAPEADAVILHFGVTPRGNHEGRTVLSVVTPIEAVSERLGADAAALVAASLPVLYAARARRPAPARDPKVIAAWNGLAIAALARAGRILGRADLVSAAREAAAFVLDGMVAGGRLHRTHQDGRPMHLGQLDDHADMCAGLLELYDATFEPRWLREARGLADRMRELFGDEDGAGFYATPADGEGLIARIRDLEDHPVPSGSSQAAAVLVRLAGLTGDHDAAGRAAAALALAAEETGRWPTAFGSALTVLDLLAHDRPEVAVTGDPADPRTAALVAAARAHGGPGTVIACGDPADREAVEAAPVLAGRPRAEGPAAHVCVGRVCLPPAATPEAVAAALRDGGA